jgi:ATP-dependent Clp protease adaptor protein ClpS
MGLFDKKYDQPEIGGDVLVEEKIDTGTGLSDKPRIILYNDDHNSFDHVIRCLVIFCQHHKSQAEQCAHIVHTRGKCSVKEGELEQLVPICALLVENGLDAKIEK